MRGAMESGNEVEKIRVASKKIAPCSACYYCKNSGECVHKDDMAEILQKMIDADVLVLASPVYFYSINAQLKAVIDRTVARWLEVKNKEFYYIATMADESLSSAKTTIDCFSWLMPIALKVLLKEALSSATVCTNQARSKTLLL